MVTRDNKLGLWRKPPVVKADNAVKFIYMHIVSGNLKASEVFRKAGVCYGTWHRWKNARGRVDHYELQCVLRVLGYQMKITEHYE